MFKKRILAAVFLFLFLFSFTGQVFSASVYNIAKVNNSEISVGSSSYGNNMRIMVEKGSEKYYYSLNNKEENLPIQLGDGTYTVKILQNVSGNRYKVLNKSNITVKGSNNLDVYLTSAQPVYWQGMDSVTSLSDNLTKSLSTDTEKVNAVYQYIIQNIKYDSNKINTISTDYVPQLENIISSKSGICYDYAALFAGMLRHQGIPTKLVKGYKNDMKEYHAWNEVLINGKWVIIDTTYDGALNSLKNKPSMYKSSSEYSKHREY
ncbi:MAG: transglutaminase domain-containing protein [Tissierellia bacterium]|nr:transglutaminase domain-containing protein [Tissierellia bacterium]